MPMDAWREGDVFVLEFDLPGIHPDSLDIDVERNVLTIKAERPSRNGDWEFLASERPKGLFSRQLVLGDNLDLDNVSASYEAGVLRLRVPVAERAKPRKISVETSTADVPELAIRVRDQGEGFDPEQLADPLAPENLLKSSGRGIFLIRNFMDEMVLQRAPQGGMEMVMVKRAQSQKV